MNCHRIDTGGSRGGGRTRGLLLATPTELTTIGAVPVDAPTSGRGPGPRIPTDGI